MDGTIFVIVLTAIICGTGMIATIFTSIFKYAMARSQSQKTDSSLTTSELHGLIREAVDEATEPACRSPRSAPRHAGPARPLARRTARRLRSRNDAERCLNR